MAYDRFERERRRRGGRQDFSDDTRGFSRDPAGRDEDRYPGREHDDRGFFDRMGDEVRSWFGDDDDRRQDYERGDDYGRRRYREGSRFGGRDERSRPMNWTASEGGYNRDYQDELDRGYRPMAGDYSRSDREDPSPSRDRETHWDRDPYRRTSFAGSRARSNEDDRHYGEMRRRRAEELDRDYDEYRRERASQFENDFSSWRERRMTKRQMLGEIREHMDVVGNDGKHVGTVDRVSGDRIILTRGDPDSGGVHHSLSCSDLDRVESDRVILDCSAEKAKERWRDESRSRALFEREDQGRAGPHILDRSFSGTYR